MPSTEPDSDTPTEKSNDTEHDPHDAGLSGPKPDVPVFYQVPQAAADRAIARFRHRRQCELAGDSELEHTVTLAEYLYEEIEEVPVIYVGAEPLYEYVGGRVDSLTIEPDGDE